MKKLGALAGGHTPSLFPHPGEMSKPGFLLKRKRETSSVRTMDEEFMRAALAEARRGLGATHPNPAVGAVIVRNGRIVARGWHRRAGGPHAEIAAIRQARSTRGATLFVTLEPCSTHGRTPPCTEALIAAGFARVVYGATDPNPAHAGRADRLLADAGLAVTPGVLATECADLNAGWNKWIATGFPWVIAKAGMTLDGRINSPPERRWITSAASRRDAMRLRARVQAILVGGETVRADNPRLTLRGVGRREQPWRVVWTRRAELPPDCHLLTDAFRERTLVYRNRPLRRVLADLGRRGVGSVLIEGGGRVLGEAFDRGLVDEVCFYLAPLLTGGPVPAVAGAGVDDPRKGPRLAGTVFTRIGDDVRLTGRVV
jgi:diaminohydroxyphosphoribosylaminopyrimidine deaminase/5-amino-6-(5-phosphoribosylamino)uracil reductase